MLSKSLEMTLHRSLSIAREYKHEYATFEHLLLALLEDQDAKSVLLGCKIDIEKLTKKLKSFLKSELNALVVDHVLEVKPTAGFQRVVHRAAIHGHATGQDNITGANVLAEFFFEHESYAVMFLKEQQLTRMDIINYLAKHSQSNIITRMQNDEIYGSDFLSEPQKTENSEVKKSPQKTQPEPSGPIATFCINLNTKAQNGEIDMLIGREQEIERTIEILCRRHKNNPLLVGEPGVGKTAIAEGLAYRIVKEDVPEVLKNAIIFALDMGSLVAGTRYRGDFEERVKSIIKELKEMPNAVLFIDEIHTIIGAGSTSGGSLDASNLLKPALARGEIHCIGSTTFKEYHNHFEKDMALVRRFQKVVVQAPDIKGTIKILIGLKTYYEEHHKVKYEESALEAAAMLSERYITDRHLPDKAIDLIDEAGAKKKILSSTSPLRDAPITVRDIEDIVAKISHIPSISIATDDVVKLQQLEHNLKDAIYGQDKAIEELCSNIKLAKAGLKKIEKPTGSYLFAGPTGVGKTELARQLAKLCNMELVRFDMSEYAEAHSVSRLIGTPPGYVGFEQGGLLTDAVSKFPYSVILLDEIEKAHKDIYNLMLQIMDYGKLTDSTGKTVNFAHSIVIMTTNAGAEQMSKASIGFGSKQETSFKKGIDELNRIFTPEFRNRLDAVIQFAPLDSNIVELIINKLFHELGEQLADKGVKITADKSVKAYLAQMGFDKLNGARMLERVIQNEIKKKIAEEILFGKLKKGGKVQVKCDKSNKITFDFTTQCSLECEEG
ncbi:MAG: ATP-dependent Clp protease ATP-binding subunit ClpA [Rickettsiaceae bacterium]|nr:ATP-dependent Clp protease ATP-binding subunit ClpA [Rickettsiaceae bacterium]